MNIAEAQQDMRRAYLRGGLGIFVSGLVWLSAGLVVQGGRGTASGFVVLFFGGMLIFPLASLISRLVFQRGAATRGNPLGATALESTIAMIGGLFAAWLILPFKPAFVFPLAAIAVGTHYAVFRTVYGDPLFVVLGALITGVGLVGVFAAHSIGGIILFAVAAIELAFAIVQTLRALRASE